MRPVVMVIASILGHESLQVALVKHDHMIEQIAAAVSNESLGHTVLPGTLEVGLFGFDSEAFDCLNNVPIEVAAPVEDKPPRCGIVGKRLSKLLRYPGAGRVASHIEMQNLTPLVRDDKETIKHPKCHRRYSEEVHCSDGFTMIS